MKEYYLFFILILFMGEWGHSQVNMRNYKRYTTQNGLSDNVIRAIHQDNKGFIWIGTQKGGLNRFDGSSFIHFQNDPGDSTSISGNSIESIDSDDQNNIWIATSNSGISKYDFKKGIFEQYLIKEQDSSKITMNNMFTIKVNSNNKVFTGNWKGLDVYDEATNSFKEVIFPDHEDSWYLNGIRNIEEKDDENLYLGSEGNGLIDFNIENGKVEMYTDHLIPEDMIHWTQPMISMAVDNENDIIWSITNLRQSYQIISHEKGNPNNFKKHLYVNQNLSNPIKIFLDSQNILWVLFQNTGFKRYKYSEGKLVSIDENLLFENDQFHAIFEDDTGSIWVGGDRGLLHFPFNLIIPKSLNVKNKNLDSVIENSISSMTILDSLLIFHSNNKGLSFLNLTNGELIVNKKLNDELFGDIMEPNVKSIFYQEPGALWLSFIKGLYRLDLKSLKFEKMEGDDFLLADFQTYNIIGTLENTLWLAASASGSMFEFDTAKRQIEKKFMHETYQEQSAKMPYYYAYLMRFDNNGNPYVSFWDTDHLFKLDLEKETFEKFDSKNGNSFGKVSDFMFKDSLVWIATSNGIYKKNLKTEEEVKYTIKEGLFDNNILDLFIDKNGNLWALAQNGISMYRDEDDYFINANIDLGASEPFLTTNSIAYYPKENRLFLGVDNGVFSIDIDGFMREPGKRPNMAFTNFEYTNINDTLVQYFNVEEMSVIELAYNERDFTVEFGLLNYSNPEQNLYSYKLEGYDENWKDLNSKNSLSFTNLNPGSYNLVIKGTSHTGFRNTAINSLMIVIRPPWWLTNWAYTLYGVLFLSLIYGLIAFRSYQLETKHLKKVDSVKNNLFTYISHEFRTPLTIISGALENFGKSNYNREELVKTIKYGNDRLLSLVNGVLQIQKIKNENVEPSFVEIDIVPLFRGLLEPLHFYAKQKKIEVHYLPKEPTLIAQIDLEYMTSILTNLVSNAIKYGKHNGHVYVELGKEQKSLVLRVRDTGIGISEENIERIFDDFYSQSTFEGSNVSVGIGLALTKYYVELMQGTILVRSRVNEGSVFTVKIPLQTNRVKLGKEMEIPVLPKPIVPLDLDKTEREPNVAQKSEIKTKPSVLIIEDNEEVLHYLVEILKDTFNVHKATTGKTGVDLAIELIPDIIISDLMMPEMDGYQVMKILKNNELTNHIPILILTANALEESQLNSWNMGADAFLVKPFKQKVLFARLNNLIEQRNLIHQKYQGSGIGSSFSINSKKRSDPFLFKVDGLILTKSNYRQYSISELCLDLGVSRSQLHNKLKALTGKSTSLYVRSVRLNKSLELLRHSDMTINEIADFVGFGDANYFSKSFKKEFGESPSSIRDKPV